MALSVEDLDAAVREVWGMAGPSPPHRVLVHGRTYWTVRFWARLSRRRRLLYWLLPDWEERDLWDWLRSHGIERRDDPPRPTLGLDAFVAGGRR